MLGVWNARSGVVSVITGLAAPGSRFRFARRVQGIALKTEAVKPSPNASKLRL